MYCTGPYWIIDTNLKKQRKLDELSQDNIKININLPLYLSIEISICSFFVAVCLDEKDFHFIVLNSYISKTL